MAAEQHSDPQAMIRLFTAYVPARAVYAAAKLGVVDAIGEGASGTAALAERLGVDAGALHRILRTLAGLGVLHQEADDRFSVTPLGATLGADSESSVRDYAILMHELIFDGFGEIVECVRTGRPVVEDLFAHLRANPDQAAVFHAGMSSRGRIENAAIIAAYDFARYGTVVDVGGGNGAFLSAVLETCELVSAVLFDQPSAIEAAKSAHGDPLPRCELVAGDFFQSVPPGGDAYVLKRVLFDFSDNQAVEILGNCRAAMAEPGRLLIIEPLIGEANVTSPAYTYDLTFLVWLHGRVRTMAEYASLLDRAGFRLERTVPTNSDVSVVEAVAR